MKLAYQTALFMVKYAVQEDVVCFIHFLCECAFQQEDDSRNGRKTVKNMYARSDSLVLFRVTGILFISIFRKCSLCTQKIDSFR